MRLVITEYLRTFRERNELDRLIPDLLAEMGYVLIARPQTGNRQSGVDIAARGVNPETKKAELLLLVIKQGDIGRSNWDGNEQSVRQSLNEILDVYLHSHVESEDAQRPIRIAVVTNGELKQTVQGNWSGYTQEKQDRAQIVFWGLEKLSELVETYLLDEHVFRDQDRQDIRRALALIGDTEYDLRDFHHLLSRTLGLQSDGTLTQPVQTERSFLKSLRAINFAANALGTWALNDGDGRQGLRAMERALLWSFHRIQLELTTGKLPSEALANELTSLWFSYQRIAKNYFEKLQEHCYTKDGISGYSSDGAEFSLVAFEQIGMLATIGLAQVLWKTGIAELDEHHTENAHAVADALASLIANNSICASPCLDRHSQDITIAMLLLLLTGRFEDAKVWLKSLIRNVDYAFKAERYVPISSDSIDDLADFGGWHTGKTEAHLMSTSWTLAVLAGWSVVLEMDDAYTVIQRGLTRDYSKTCAQLWHPDENIHKHLYFHSAHFLCGAAEAPIKLPEKSKDWLTHMRIIATAPQMRVCEATLAWRAGMPAIDFIACRHFGTPVAPFHWYRLVALGKVPEEPSLHQS